MKNIISKLDNEIFLILTGITSIIVLYAFSVFGVFSIILSFICIFIAVIYYSVTFFSSNHKPTKIFYFFGMTLVLILYYAVIYHSFGIISTATQEPTDSNWQTSIYFSVVTWTTLGYGDYIPNEDTQLWAISQALIGYLFMGMLVGKLLIIGQLKLSKEE